MKKLLLTFFTLSMVFHLLGQQVNTNDVLKDKEMTNLSDDKLSFENREINNQDESDRKFVLSLLQKIVYDSIKFDNESDRKEYSLIYPKNILDNTATSLDNKLKSVLYQKLLQDIDFYEKLGVNTQTIIFNKLLEEDNISKTKFFRMSYRNRDETVRKIFVKTFKEYYNIDLEKGKIYKIQDSNKQFPINLEEIEIKSTQILAY